MPFDPAWLSPRRRRFYPLGQRRGGERLRPSRYFGGGHRRCAHALALAVALGPGRLIRSMALLPRRHLIWASAAMALFQWSFFGAVAKAGATTATLVSAAAAPLAAGAIAAAQRRCWPRGGWWSALGVASSGVSLVTTHGPNSAAAAGSAGGDRNGFPGGVGVAAHCRFLTTLSQRTGGAGLTQHGPGPPRFIHCCLSTRRNTCRTQHTAP